MYRINLFIVDSDESYLESLTGYILNNYSYRFQVSTFTKKDRLMREIEESQNIIDVLLINSDLYSKDLNLDKINTCLILSAGKIVEDYRNFDIINKYQPAEGIVMDILKYYSEKNSDEIINIVGDKNTKVIGVISPAGGAGKTSLAINLSVQAAARGQSVFYLNLESVNSTANHFKIEGPHGLSDIFFYIKEKNMNIGMKIEALKSVDITNVHYFNPQESILELEEMSAEEITSLIANIVKIGQYDMVFVDMSSNLNKNNIAVLKVCNRIVCVLTPNRIDEVKMKFVDKELERLQNRGSINVIKEILLVANKWEVSNPSWIDYYKFQGQIIRHRIPFVPNLMANSLNNGSRFNNSVNEVLNDLMV